MGDDFANILQSNFGLRPSGKAAPMSKGQGAPKPLNPSSNGKGGSGISTFGSKPASNGSGSTQRGTGPNLDIPDNFGAPPPPPPSAGIFDAPHDVFADLSQAARGSTSPNQTSTAEPTGYDSLFGDVGKPPSASAKDDIFGGLGGGFSGAQKVNDDVFGMGTSSSGGKAGVKVDDLLGNLGGFGANRAKPQNSASEGDDDILGGLGAAPSTRPAAKASTTPRVPDLYGDSDSLENLASPSTDPFGGFPGAAASNGAPSPPAASGFDDWGMPAPQPPKPVSSQNRSTANEGRSAKPAERAPLKTTEVPKGPAPTSARSTNKPEPSKREEVPAESIPVAPVSTGPKFLTVDQIVLRTKPTKAPPPLRMPPSRPGEPQRRPSVESRRTQHPPPSYKEAQQATSHSRSSSSQGSDVQRSNSAPRSNSTPPPQSQGSGSFFSGFSRPSNSARSSDGDRSNQGTPRTHSGESTPTFEDTDTKGAASAASASAAAMAAALERAQAKHRASYERKQREEREAAAKHSSASTEPPPREQRRPSNNAPPRPAAKPAPQPTQPTDFFSAPPRRPSKAAEPDLMNAGQDAPKSYSSVEDLFGTGSRRNSAADDLGGSKQKPSSRSANDLSGLTTPDWGSAFGVADPDAEAGVAPNDSEERRKAKLAKAERLKERADAALRAKQEVDSKQASEADERHRCDELYGNYIKQWASGKEGNLRALLSTLQFVLWPECEWTPVQMTDLITGNSVKKIYQKAILRVHPDKVQQKGATVKQKYIAGKVFDLLKEAYNKFNSTELF